MSEFGQCVETKGKVVVNSRDPGETKVSSNFYSKKMMNDIWPSQFSIVHLYLLRSLSIHISSIHNATAWPYPSYFSYGHWMPEGRPQIVSRCRR